MKRILIVSLILWVSPLFAQKEIIDSLLTVLKTAQEDTMRVKALNDLSFQFSLTSNFNDELIYATEALKLAQKLNWKKGQATAFNNIGGAYDNKANNGEALKNYFESLKINEEIGDKKGIAFCHNNIGIVYYNIGNYEDALKNYFTSLQILQEMGNKMAIASVYNNIGNAYDRLNNSEDALKSLMAALKTREEIGDQIGLASSYDNVGIIHLSLGNYAEALKNYMAGLKIREEIGDIDGLSYSYLNLGAYYYKLNNPLLCKEYRQKALELGKEIGSLDVISDSYFGLSEADSALACSPQTSPAKRAAYWQSAYENYRLHRQYRDSIVNEENTEKVVQTQMQYEFDKKEAATKAEQEKKDAIAHEEVKRQRNIRNSAFIGLTGLLFFSIIVFMQRNKIAKGKKRSDELLLNILPEEVAEELKLKGSADAKQFDDVTVMFTDFKGFTQLSEKLSPKELVGEINECFSAFDHIMQKHGIEKIKTIGDAYMAAGGLPTANNTHANDVVLAAMEIQQYMHEHKAIKEASGQLFFEIRIGVHTGPVVAGIVGIKKFAYDIWGDTVNTASRMESSGQEGKVNISGATYELVKDKFKCEHRGKIQAKNKGEIDMYFVEAVS